jgi:hypothetical protein
MSFLGKNPLLPGVKYARSAIEFVAFGFASLILESFDRARYHLISLQTYEAFVVN